MSRPEDFSYPPEEVHLISISLPVSSLWLFGRTLLRDMEMNNVTRMFRNGETNNDGVVARLDLFDIRIILNILNNSNENCTRETERALHEKETT